MVRFKALESAIVSDSKAPNRQDVIKDVAKDDALEMKIINAIHKNAFITAEELAESLGAPRTIQRKVKLLKDQGCIERKGGKRYGYWEVREK